MGVLGNSITLLQDYQTKTTQLINDTCLDIDELKLLFSSELQAKASAAGAAIGRCGQDVYHQLQLLVSENFYEYYHELQIQSLSAKNIIFLPFEVFNPMTNQYEIYWIAQEIVNETYITFRIYIQPEVEAEVHQIAVRGQQIIDAVTKCAFDTNVEFSQVVNLIQADIRNQCGTQ